MDPLADSMIREARRLFRTIRPCGTRRSLYDCFTIKGDELLMWFNTPDESTHILRRPLRGRDTTNMNQCGTL